MPKIRVVIDDVLRRVLCPLLWTCAEGTVWVASGWCGNRGAAHKERVWMCEWDTRCVHRSRER